MPAIVGSGLVFAGLSDTCAMGMLLARLPYNRGRCHCDTEAIVRQFLAHEGSHGMTPAALFLALTIGLSMGVLGGGGSIIAVPALTFLLHFPPKEAVVTSLAIVGAVRGSRCGRRASRAAPCRCRWPPWSAWPPRPAPTPAASPARTSPIVRNCSCWA